jgi:cyanate permease
LVAWRGVIPAFVATTAGMLPGFLIAAFAVQIRTDIDLSLTGLGVLIGVFFGTAALVSPMMGRLSERIGWAAALRLATVLSAVSLGGIGWLVDTTAGLAIFYVIGGLGSSLGQIASNLAVARCVDLRRQGLVFGLRHASVPAAALIAGLAVPAIALTVGWRWGFRGGVLIAVAAMLSIPWAETPHVINPAREAADSAGAASPATPLPLLIILAVAVGLGTGGVDTVGSFIVSYSVEEGINENTAGLLLAIGSLAGLTARVVAGWLIDRVRHADLTAVATMITTGAIGMILLNNGGRIGLFAGALIAFAAGWGWAGLFTFAIVKDNPAAPAAASGVTQTGKYIGAALGPPVFGTIADTVSFRAAWWFSTVVLLIAASLMIYVRNRRPE